MVHPHGAEVRRRARLPSCKHALDLGDPLRGLRQPRRTGHEQAAACGSPHGQVARAVADVVETPFAEFRDEAFALAAGRQVHVAVAGQHRVEEVQLVSHRAGDLPVGTGGQDQVPPAALLGAQILHQFTVERQRAHIDGRPLGEALLQLRATLREPRRHFQQGQRMRPGHGEQRLHQRVGAQQAAIEIHDQRHLGCLAGADGGWMKNG